MENNLKQAGTVAIVILYIILVCGCAVIAAVPWIAPTIECFFISCVSSMAYMYIGGIGAVWLIVEMIRIMYSVRSENPFVMRNVKSLKHMALAACIALIDNIIMMILKFSFVFVVVSGVLVLGILLAIVLEKVFRRAVEYKLENDLTI